jgi:protein-S-isoprenylcysteine O-methyltransferase Ste14
MNELTTNEQLWITINSGLWWICGICWGFWWRQVKRTVSKEPTAARALHLVPTIIAFALIFTPYFQMGFMGYRFIDQNPLWQWLGCALTFLGLAFAIWARIHLGKNWSAIVTVKENHQLIRSGPYQYARHPIYTGFVFAFLGTVLTVGKVNGIIALIIFVVTYIRKLRTEELVLWKEFGEQYTKYKSEVKALIPFIY